MKTALILGAGIVGLSTAIELAFRGIEMTVLERGEAMREASWAAAGMLAANDPENPPQLTSLARLSLALYPDFLSRVEQLSGVAVPLRTTHTLQICQPGHEPASGHIELSEAMRRVPGLAAALAEPLLWLEEQSLDPRDLCRALPLAARAAGVSIREHCPVLSIRRDSSNMSAETAAGSFTADFIVACTGAWTNHLKPLSIGVSPRKGQMLAARPIQGPSLTVVLRSPEIYLVPRGDGRIIVGATVEDAGFDRATYPAATAWLIEKAATLWPPIRNASIEEVWTGLRPGSPDGLPLIGPLSQNANDNPLPSRMWVAAGHYRNGILLAPATARLLADLIIDPDSPSAMELVNFLPSRCMPALIGKH